MAACIGGVRRLTKVGSLVQSSIGGCFENMLRRNYVCVPRCHVTPTTDSKRSWCNPLSGASTRIVCVSVSVYVVTVKRSFYSDIQPGHPYAVLRISPHLYIQILRSQATIPETTTLDKHAERLIGNN